MSVAAAMGLECSLLGSLVDFSGGFESLPADFVSMSMVLRTLIRSGLPILCLQPARRLALCVAGATHRVAVDPCDRGCVRTTAQREQDCCQTFAQ